MLAISTLARLYKRIDGAYGRFNKHGDILYYAVCICIVVVAAWLRFYDLGGNSLWFDEAIAANYARGTFAEVFSNTRYSNSSPLAYPLALYAIQKFESSAFTVRLIPAVSSVLTVGVFLFVLPRVGVKRGIALLAGLMATLSTEAIFHAQDVREYGVDAFIAVLMIAGALAYLKDGNRILLCVSLFIAPMVQYGLVLFGIAVIATLALSSGAYRHARVPDGYDSYFRRMSDWTKRRVDLVLPSLFFAIGSVMSLLLTLRYQWSRGGDAFAGDSYLLENYYQGIYSDAFSVLPFATSRTWELLHFHMPDLVVMLAIPSFILVLLISARHMRFDAIVLLCIFTVVVCMLAGLLRLYPYGAIRQSMYLGPFLFLGAGFAFYSLGNYLSSLLRQRWMILVLVVAFSLVVIDSGADAIRIENPHREFRNVRGALEVLEDELRDDDAVYVSSGATPVTMFYTPQSPPNYHYRGCSYKNVFEQCANDVLDLVSPDMERLWLLFSHGGGTFDWGAFELLADGVRVENVFDFSEARLWLITNAYLLSNNDVDFAGVMSGYVNEFNDSGDAIVRSDFDLYVSENDLIYVKSPCTASDFQANFFLHVFPKHTDSLSVELQGRGVENFDFNFGRYGVIYGDKCRASVPLPNYEVARIRTGQFTHGEGRLWDVKYDFIAGEVSSVLVELQTASIDPVIRSNFDVYMDTGRLLYHKSDCSAADRDTRFFLHLDAVDIDDLPEARREHGFDNLNFNLLQYGGETENGECVALIDLPEYEIDRIHTGQFNQEARIWEGEYSIAK